MPKIIENKIIEEFKNKEKFSRDELFTFFIHYEPNLKESTFGWRIYDLKKKNIIKTIGRGMYVISYKPKYKPIISESLLKIARKTEERLDGINYCIWDTEWLNEFTQHQISNPLIIIEIERDFIDSLYYYLNDHLRMDFFLNPDDKDIQFYITESNAPVVIKRLITRAPTVKQKDKKVSYSIATLEKIMVDLFADDKLFHSYQGSEMGRIYENIINNYNINFTRLFSYAKRRKKEQEIKHFMDTMIPNLLNNIIDD
tara:strand:- start:2349 stop:3116 length:768 start_codon:yes stop_codon:yes gene_type:complete